MSVNFWDPNESQSSDDEYNTPSSPSSSVTLHPPLAVATTTTPSRGKRHHQRPSISAIRLPVQMSDDEEEDHKAGGPEQADDEPENEEFVVEEQQEDDDPNADQPAQPVAAGRHTEQREILFRMSDRRSDKARDELKTADEEQSLGPSTSAVSTSSASFSPPPPPLPARRSSQPLPPLTLSAPPSRFGSTMPSFPPPPSSSPSSSAASDARPSSSPPSSSSSSSASAAAPLSARPSSAFSASSSASPVRTFSSHLRHCFEPVSRQAAAGSYSTKRTAALLKRIALLDEQHAAAIAKAMQTEQAKLGRLGADLMDGSTTGWQLILDTLSTAVQSHSSTAHSVVLDVVVPLLEYYSDAEEKRNKLIADERKATAEMTRQADDVQRTLAATVKLLTAAKAQMDSDGGGGGGMKTLTKHFRQSVKATTAQAVKSAKQYNDSIAAANARQHRYQQADLPLVFNGLEQLERSRLELCKHSLLRYADLQIAALQQQLAQLLYTRQQLAAQLQPAASVAAYIDATIAAYPPPATPAPFQYALGVSVRDMEEGRLDAPIPAAPPLTATGVFGMPLQTLIEREEERNKEETAAGLATVADTEEYGGAVPRVLSACVQRLSQRDGYATEGIFRISIPKVELDSLRAAIDRDDYGSLLAHPNPHAAACILKDFLRSLPAPVIPDALYAQCIAVGMERTADGLACDEPTCLRAVAGLGDVERRVLSLLGAVCDSVEHASEVTRMSVDNMGIVLAPCLLRNRSADAARLLEYTKYEAKFVSGLMKALVHRRRGGKTEHDAARPSKAEEEKTPSATASVSTAVDRTTVEPLQARHTSSSVADPSVIILDL